jgi:hypothetical protein
LVLDGAFTAPKASPAGPKPYAGAKLDPASLAGVYVSAGAQSVIHIGVAKGALILNYDGSDLPLVQTGPLRFETSQSPIRAELDTDLQGLVIEVRGEKEPPYRRVPAYSPTLEDLATWAGRYHSVELGTDWTIRVDKDIAYLNGRLIGRLAGTPVSKDIWMWGTGFFALRRGPDGRAAGFDLSLDRMMRIHFDRLGPA